MTSGFSIDKEPKIKSYKSKSSLQEITLGLLTKPETDISLFSP